jgi:hypothetical protein
VISTDVLEHCPEDDLPWIVAEMFAFAERFLYATVACFPAKKRLPSGENAHCTIRPPAWWEDLFQRVAASSPGIYWELSASVRTADGAPAGEERLTAGAGSGVIRAFIGYDSREAIASVSSRTVIHARASAPVCVTPLMLRSLAGPRRGRETLQSTDFAFTRFLTPHPSPATKAGACSPTATCSCSTTSRSSGAARRSLLRHGGQARSPAARGGEVPRAAADRVSEEELVERDAVQQRAATLTLQYVNAASGLELHQFKWRLADEALDRRASGRWNHLVGYDPPSWDVSLVH